jgi:hypothetical protein
MSNSKVWMVAAISVLGATLCPANAIAQSNTQASTGTNGAALGSSWDDIKKMPDFFTGIWQSAGSMVDAYQKVGYTAKAQEYIKNYKPKDEESKDPFAQGYLTKAAALLAQTRNGTTTASRARASTRLRNCPPNSK